jgi:hypothetical protein
MTWLGRTVGQLPTSYRSDLWLGEILGSDGSAERDLFGESISPPKES